MPNRAAAIQWRSAFASAGSRFFTQILELVVQLVDPGLVRRLPVDRLRGLAEALDRRELLEHPCGADLGRGEVKSLAAGATPLDFAYEIHTELGHRCVGAKVNGKIVPLNYALKSGDIVEVLT